MAGLTALLGRAREKSVDDDKLLNLYWNRAELKKAFADLRKEKYRLQDKLREADGATARLQQKLDRLEELLLDPEWCDNVLVFYQLRSLALRCRRKLARFAEQLKQQRERRRHEEVVQQWQEARAGRLRAIEQQLAERRALLETLESEAEAQRKRLSGLGRFLKILGRRSVRVTLDRLAKEMTPVRVVAALLVAQREAIAAEAPPETPGLDIAAKRSVNCTILAFAQQLFLDFGDPELAMLAKEAGEKSVGAIRYGGRADCAALLGRIRASARALEEKPDVAGILQQRAKLIGEAAKFRNGGDAVPIAATVATLYDVREDGGLQKSDLNLLAENYWGIASVLSR